MEGTIANELYSEITKNTTSELGSRSAGKASFDATVSDGGDDDLWYEDESPFDGAVESSNKATDMDREWLRRHDQFHTIGYRDGLMAGKEASAQEGFNIGFKESVFVGLTFGLVRGVTSALACLPDGLRERLVETEEKRIKFQHLHESVHSLSTTDALKLFHDSLTNKLAKSANAKTDNDREDTQVQSSDANVLEDYHRELQSLILESPAIKLNLEKDQ